MRSDAYERRRQKVLASRCSGRVLDLGHAAMPNPFLDGPMVTGVDLDAPVTPSGYAEDLKGSVMELTEVVGAQQFDTVVAAELIEHLEDPYGFLRALHPVIRPGGSLVLSTPNPLGFPVAFFEALRSQKRFYAEDHTFYFLPRWMARVLDNCGFSLVETIPVGLWLPVGFVLPAPVWLSYQVIYVAKPRD